MKKKSKFLTMLALIVVCAVTTFIMIGCGPEKLTDYSITYELNGGINNHNNPETFNEKTNTFFLFDPTRTGYTFRGWFSDESFQTKITSIRIGTKKDITLYAKWSVNEYTITFNTHDAVTVITQDYGTTITFPESSTKDGYVFSGWYKDSTLTQSFTSNTMPAEDITLYAKYEAMFNVSGGTINGLTTYAEDKVNLEVVIPDRIDGYNITSIAANAFLSNSNMVSVVIGTNVTNIGENAFARCSKLTSVNIPNSVTTMGENVFFDCPKLETATVGTGLTTLPKATFGECSKLTSLTLSEGLVTIEDLAIAKCEALTQITIPNSVVEIKYGALAQNSSLTTVNMGTGVRTLGENVFLSDTKLTTINLPEGIKTISKGLFAGCSSLTTITLPSSVTKIEDDVFVSCSKLESITIPKAVTSIGNTVFQKCPALKIVTFASDGALNTVGEYLFQECSNLETVTFPNNLQTLSKGMFYKCGKLQNVTLPTELRTVSQSAFYQCSSLDVLILPSKVTKIESLAFESCSELYIYIPTSVTTIESMSAYGESASYSPFHSSYARIYCEKASVPSGWSQHWNKSSASGMRPVEWNTSLEEFDDIIHPYRDVVAQINGNLNDAKNIFNTVVNDTVNSNLVLVYEDGNRFEFNKTKNFIYCRTENTEYLQLYKNGSNLMYSASYSASDAANGYGYIQAMDLTMVEESVFEYDVKNHLHAIYDIVDIKAIESVDYYTIKVTIEFEPESSFVIEYRVKDNKINGMIIDGEEVSFYTSNNDYTYNSNPFSLLTKLTIDETFLKDTTILDFTMLENVNTVEISTSLTVPEYVTNNFTLSGTEGIFKVYTKNN